MSKHVRSQFEWKILVEDPESSERVDPVAVQQHNDEQAQQDKPPTESQDVTPDQDNEDERAPVVPDPDLETELQGLALHETGHEGNVKGASFAKLQPIPLPAAETDVQDLAQLKTGDEGSEVRDFMEDMLLKLESIYMPDAGEGQPQD
ncbi:putative G antigen family E member 3 isoform 1-T4 [Hipposideros larvatus]